MDAKGLIRDIYVNTDNSGAVDRVEHVERDTNGNIIRRDYYIGSEINGSPNSVRYYDIDTASGFVSSESNDRNNDTTIDSKNVYTRDIYGNARKIEYDTNADGQIDSTTHQEFDEKNRLVHQWNDKNNNGVKDSPDTEGTLYEYDALNRLTHATIKTYTNSGSSTEDVYREYNDLGQVTKLSFDYSRTGVGIDTTYLYEYEPVFGARVKETFTQASSNIGMSTHYEIDDIGSIELGLRDIFDKSKGEDKFVDQIALGGDFNGGSSYSSSLDLTTWNTDPARTALFNHSLARITLSGSAAVSELTLDKDTLGALASSTLMIKGDIRDTVTFKDAQTEFTKLSTQITGNYGNGVQTYDQYTTQIDGKTYTIQIDTDINLTFGG